MDIAILKNWLSVLATVLSLGAIAYAWLTRRSTENSGRLSQAEKKLVEYDRRIQSIESDLKHMPDHEQIAGIRIAITKLDGGMQRVEDLISAQTRAMQRVEKHLFEDHKGQRG
ncbi:MAG: DUF2730 family protein [Paracoccaceae bacterium]